MDVELVRAAQTGDQDAFALLYERHAPRLRLFCARRAAGNWELAEDAVQETFVSAQRHLRTLERPERFRPWLYVIAHRELIRALSRAPATESLDVLTEEPADAGVDPEQSAVATDHLVLLHTAMGGLGDADRQLVGQCLHGLRGQELADAVGTRLPSMQVHLYQAKQRLRVAVDALPLAHDAPDRCPELHALFDGCVAGNADPGNHGARTDDDRVAGPGPGSDADSDSVGRASTRR